MDYFTELFGGEMTEAERLAGIENMEAAEAARLAQLKEDEAARKAAAAANRCPRCMGEGRIAQFTHRKGGECFLCGGSGIFTRFAA